jgi:hypothetical protein
MWEHKFSAVASNSPSFERALVAGPYCDRDHVLHEWLLAGWGTMIRELFNLEDISEKCKKERRWSFFVSSMLLNVKGEIVSPPNAVGIF